MSVELLVREAPLMRIEREGGTEWRQVPPSARIKIKVFLADGVRTSAEKALGIRISRAMEQRAIELAVAAALRHQLPPGVEGRTMALTFDQLVQAATETA